MEYMLAESLPIYSGGLGNVAGDQLKAASDLGVPVVGIGLLYQQGYFRQIIDHTGRQQALHPYNDPMQLPLLPVRNDAGEWVRVEVPHPAGRVWARAWRAQVGRLPLYLLDTNDPANPPALRGITAELYGGGPETRLAQELVLGIGGCRLLTELGIEPEVFHLNEGHAAFATIERARTTAARTGLPLADALTATRAGNLFTTHTPVDAGFDRFDPALFERFLGRYASEELGIDVADLLALGRSPRRSEDPGEPFTTAFFAIATSAAVNGVSELHGEVSRRLFADLFPRWPVDEIPIGSVTNGIHISSWDSDEADALWQRSCGRARWFGLRPGAEAGILTAGDEELWAMRAGARAALVGYARERSAQQVAGWGDSTTRVAAASRLFESNTLTIGFARRFAPYKRPTLLLHDPERLARILTDPRRPVQLLVAGKAHPDDGAGQDMVRRWNEFASRPDVAGRVAFLADYDMMLTKHLVQGVDVWLNTPRRPWEASGTSGMKVLVNGGLNLSELDGWWAEAWEPDLGWALGDGLVAADDATSDAEAADELYRLLESEIVPTFYDRDISGIPRAWVARMRASMHRLTPRFSADRTVREYVASYYLPLAEAFRGRMADECALARSLSDWQERTAARFGRIHIGRLEISPEHGRVDLDRSMAVHVYLNDLRPDDVRVEAYADGELRGDPPVVVPLTAVDPLIGSHDGWLYRGVLPGGRPIRHFTPRVIPEHPHASVPLENRAIVWLDAG
jgi:starch phosphorylase